MTISKRTIAAPSLNESHRTVERLTYYRGAVATLLTLFVSGCEGAHEFMAMSKNTVEGREKEVVEDEYTPKCGMLYLATYGGQYTHPQIWELNPKTQMVEHVWNVYNTWTINGIAISPTSQGAPKMFGTDLSGYGEIVLETGDQAYIKYPLVEYGADAGSFRDGQMQLAYYNEVLAAYPFDSTPPETLEVGPPADQYLDTEVVGDEYFLATVDVGNSVAAGVLKKFQPGGSGISLVGDFNYGTSGKRIPGIANVEGVGYASEQSGVIYELDWLTGSLSNPWNLTTHPSWRNEEKMFDLATVSGPGGGSCMPQNGCNSASDDPAATSYDANFDPNSGPGGTPSNPYAIYNGFQLQSISENLAALSNKHYVQCRDIDMNEVYSSDDPYFRMGDSVNPFFMSSYNGNGYVIDNFTYVLNGPYYQEPSVDPARYIGLFGMLRSSTIKNVVMQNVNVDVPNAPAFADYVGSLGGFSDASTFMNIQVGGKVRGERWTGGMIGYLKGGYAEHVLSTVEATGTRYAVGGLAAYIIGGEVTKSEAHGDVRMAQSGREVGGFAGDIVSSVISYCRATGNIEGGGEAGGFAASVAWNQLSFSYATGDVSSYTTIDVEPQFRKAGGFVARLGTYGWIHDCYATGSVFGETAVGGFVGRSEGGLDQGGTIENAYASGAVVQANQDAAGGFIGRTMGQGGPTIRDSFTAVASVFAPADFGHFAGAWAGTGFPSINNHFDSTASCGPGCNNSWATPHAPTSYFYSQNNAPMSSPSWNFSPNTWAESPAPGDFPKIPTAGF